MNNTWAQIAGSGGIAVAGGGILAELGKATGSEFLTDAGGILSTIGKSATSIAAAGAFQQASAAERTASLVGASPIVQTLIATQATPTPAQATMAGTPQAVATSQERATGGLLDALAQLIALPFKLIAKVLGKA